MNVGSTKELSPEKRISITPETSKNFKNLGLKNKYQKQSYDILTLLEVGNDVDPRRGNVPATQTDKSGLTVGLGFDIGQFDLEELQSFRFSNNLIKKMTPYLGLKGQAARTKHGAEMQWALTDQELDEVNKHILTKSIDKFISQDELINLMENNNFENCNYRNFSGGIVAIHSGWKI